MEQNVASDSVEEVLVEALPVATEITPVLADTDQDVAGDEPGEDFLAALADTIDSDKEEESSTEETEEC